MNRCYIQLIHSTFLQLAQLNTLSPIDFRDVSTRINYSNIGNLYVKYISLTYHVGEFFVRYLTLAYMTLYQFLGCVTHSLSILAMIVCYCTYTCITIQIVGCLEGWVELVSVYLREVKFIPVTLNQL